MRRYTLAGFELHPCVVGWGTVRRSGLSTTPQVRAGDESDLEWMTEIDRQVRRATRIEELMLCLREGDQLLVVAGRGYALLRRTRVASLVALDDDAATQLLTAGLAETQRRRAVFPSRTVLHGSGRRGALAAAPPLNGCRQRRDAARLGRLERTTRTSQCSSPRPTMLRAGQHSFRGRG